jgi:hypothetical protein
MTMCIPSPAPVAFKHSKLSSLRRCGRLWRTLLAVGLGVTGLARGQSFPLLEGFDAISNTGWIPADPTIAAGPSSLVTMVSGRIAIFDQQGTKLFEQSLGAGGFWAAQGAEGVAEPWVIFDPHSDRFIAIGAEVYNTSDFLYLAVSKSSTPTGSADWYKHAIDLTGTDQNPAHAGEPTAPDYPKAGVDVQALYITAQHFGKISGVYSHNHVIAIPKAPLLSGGAPDIVYQQSFTTWGPLHPVMVFDPLAPMYFVTQDPNFEAVTIYALADVLTAPDLSVSTSTVPAFDQPPDVPQLGSETRLSSVGSRFMSGVVRNGSLWTAHAISDPAVESGAVALVRWYKFDVAAFPTSGAILDQSGKVDSDPGIHTWLPAINVDADGNMGLSFSVCGASQYAAIGYTGRFASDLPGYTHPLQIARAGAGPYTQGGWGEYSGLAIDPNGQTFWLCHLYPTKQKNWRTFVGSFRVIRPAPPTNPLHCGDLDGRGSSQSGQKWRATVVVTMHDGNEAAVPGATVSIQWSTSATATATTDANGQCAFTLSNLSKQNTPSVTLTITGSTHATLSYPTPAMNHDSDGDSNGTSITVSKP